MPEVMTFHSEDYINFLKRINEQDDEEKYDEEAELYGLSRNILFFLFNYKAILIVFSEYVCM